MQRSENARISVSPQRFPGTANRNQASGIRGNAETLPSVIARPVRRLVVAIRFSSLPGRRENGLPRRCAPRNDTIPTWCGVQHGRGKPLPYGCIAVRWCHVGSCRRGGACPARQGRSRVRANGRLIAAPTASTQVLHRRGRRPRRPVFYRIPHRTTGRPGGRPLLPYCLIASNHIAAQFQYLRQGEDLRLAPAHEPELQMVAAPGADGHGDGAGAA